MGHEDAGHYAMKHSDKTINPKIAALLEKEAVNRTITCKALHDIAENLGIKPKEVGVQADLMELRLKKCSLGLFGYEPSGKNLNKDVQITEALLSEIQKISANNRTSCIQCWSVASKLNISKRDIGSACDKIGIKIKHCQLGAF